MSLEPVAPARMRGSAAQAELRARVARLATAELGIPVELRAHKVLPAATRLVPTSVARIQTATSRRMPPASHPVEPRRVAFAALSQRHRAPQTATARPTGRHSSARWRHRAHARLAPRSAFQDVWIRPAVTQVKCARPTVASRPPVKVTQIARPTSGARVEAVAARHARRMRVAAATA